jgi:hypothetical protein
MYIKLSKHHDYPAAMYIKLSKHQDYPMKSDVTKMLHYKIVLQHLTYQVNNHRQIKEK